MTERIELADGRWLEVDEGEPVYICGPHSPYLHERLRRKFLQGDPVSLIAEAKAHAETRKELEAVRGRDRYWQTRVAQAQEAYARLERKLAETEARHQARPRDRPHGAGGAGGDLHREGEAVILTPEERRLYADHEWWPGVLPRLWEAYVVLEESHKAQGEALLKCHEIIAGAWEALGSLVHENGEGTLGQEIIKALWTLRTAETNHVETALRLAIARAQELERLTAAFCNDPEDRMWHAADSTWWRREGDRLVSAEAPT